MSPALKGRDIPPGSKPSIGTIPRRLPVSDRLCRGCGTLMAKALVDAGEDYHICCGPDRRPMQG